MRVQDIMSDNPVVVHDTMTFLDAAKLFLLSHVTAAPVVNSANELVGILSEKDLFRAFFPGYDAFYAHPERYIHDAFLDEVAEDAAKKLVRDIMSRQLITARPDMHVLKIGGLMVSSGMHQLPVVDDGAVVGMISRGDIYRALLHEKFNVPQNYRQIEGKQK